LRAKTWQISSCPFTKGKNYFRKTAAQKLKTQVNLFMAKRFQLFVFIIFSFVLVPFAAQAGQEPPAIKAYLDMIARQNALNGGTGGRPTYGSLTPDGDGGGVLTDLKMELKNGKTAIAAAIGEMTLSGVSQRDNGQYSFASVNTKNIVLAMNLPDVGPMTIKIPTVTMSNLSILPAVAADGMDYTQFVGTAVYESANIPVITISIAGMNFQANDFRANWSGDADTGFGTWKISMGSMVFPVSLIPDAKAREEIQSELGLENLDLSLNANAAISGQNKNVSLAYAFRLKAKKIGALEFALGVNDVPVALAAVLKEVNAGGKPNMGKLMPLIVGIKLAKLKIRFVDDNFAEKALQFAARKQGTTVEAMTANGGAIIQIGLAQLRAPEFTKSVVDAYNNFIASPGNISLEASPAQPVAVATLMGMMAAPAAALQTLGVKVLANQ
jgi:hypothetical protein